MCLSRCEMVNLNCFSCCLLRGQKTVKLKIVWNKLSGWVPGLIKSQTEKCPLILRIQFSLVLFYNLSTLFHNLADILISSIFILNNVILWIFQRWQEFENMGTQNFKNSLLYFQKRWFSLSLPYSDILAHCRFVNNVEIICFERTGAMRHI